MLIIETSTSHSLRYPQDKKSMKRDFLQSTIAKQERESMKRVRKQIPVSISKSSKRESQASRDAKLLLLLRHFTFKEEDIIICNRLRCGLKPSWFYQHRDWNQHWLQAVPLVKNEFEEELQYNDEPEEPPVLPRGRSATVIDTKAVKNGRYLIHEALADGSYGHVCAGEDLLVGPSREKVVIKIIPKHLLQSIEEKESVYREQVIHRTLKHPHIVTLHDSFEDAEAHYFILERAKTGSLTNIVSPRGLSEAYCRTLMQQVLSALQYLHSNQIVHHDIKPQNILLHSEHHVKLCDFGASRTLLQGDKKLMFAGVFGTAGYIAPELLLGAPQYGPAIDMFSAGVVLFELIFGYAPFYPASSCTYETVEFSNHVKASEEVKDLIRGLLEKDPEKRYTVEEALAHKWFDIEL